MKPYTKTKWTPHEDSVLRSYVMKHPENLRYCFFLASKELNKTPKAVEMRWYYKLKHQTAHKGWVFMLFGKLRKFINCKNVRKDYGK